MRRLYRATRRGAVEGDRCDLCAAPLSSAHEHLFAPRERELACVCLACSLIEIARYRRVPKRFTPVAVDSGALLARLNVPVGIAAIIVHDDGRRVVAYPGPAGLVEAELDAVEDSAGRRVVAYPGPVVEAELDAADDSDGRAGVSDVSAAGAAGISDVSAPAGVRSDHDALSELPRLRPEVEALVCSSLSGGGAWISGIDIVFELVGELRRHWRGLTGGPEAPAAIARVIAAHAGAIR